MTNSKPIINLQIPADMKAALEAHARDHGTTVAHLVRSLIKEHFPTPGTDAPPFDAPRPPIVVFTPSPIPLLIDLEYETDGNKWIELSLPIIGWGPTRSKTGKPNEPIEIEPYVYAIAPFVEDGLVPAVSLRVSAHPTPIMILGVRHTLRVP